MIPAFSLHLFVRLALSSLLLANVTCYKEIIHNKYLTFLFTIQVQEKITRKKINKYYGLSRRSERNIHKTLAQCTSFRSKLNVSNFGTNVTNVNTIP